jgi:putative effector of murein hydrolase
MSQNAVTATVVVVSGSTILGAALNPNIDRTRVIFRAVAGGFLLGAVLCWQRYHYTRW